MGTANPILTESRGTEEVAGGVSSHAGFDMDAWQDISFGSILLLLLLLLVVAAWKGVVFPFSPPRLGPRLDGFSAWRGRRCRRRSLCVLLLNTPGLNAIVVTTRSCSFFSFLFFFAWQL